MINKKMLIFFCVFFLGSLTRFLWSMHDNGFQNLCAKSNAFNLKVPFPTNANRIGTIAQSDVRKQKRIVQHAQSVRPIIHQRVVQLIKNFLVYKRKHGFMSERRLYSSMNESAFIDRLLINRPLMFMTNSDRYLLRDGIEGHGGFESIGTDQEKPQLTLQNYLSYDEMQIAALLGVSVPTYFINNGSRDNQSQKGIPGTFQEEGIYVGLVGARFEKPGLMEWQHMIVTPQNHPKTKQLKLWEQFYGHEFATFEQADSDTTGCFIPIGPEMYLDAAIYKKRMQMVIEPFLADANGRGAKQNKKVYCHAVGLGLGVWQKSPTQAKLMLEVYADIIKSRDLSHIADIDFSWFPVEHQSINGIMDGGIFKTKQNEIMIHFSKRNPADKLIGRDAGKLLIAMYAWDGNAYPGNEYWIGALTASGDPAAASCSTIAELQNPLINENVSARNLFIVNKGES